MLIVSAKEAAPKMRKLNFTDFLRLFFFLFVTGTVLFVPFPYYFLPDTGGFFRPYILAFLTFLWQIPTLTLDSDSKGMYLWAVTWAAVSVLAALGYLWGKKSGKFLVFIQTNFPSFVAFYLSLQLFRYGWDKVFKHQFYLPEPNTLFTPLGYLDKDILYWSTMGSSYSFTVFGGIMELIPAVLLLFRPTRIIGAAITFGVFLQVLMINIGFDITVKCLSGFLLLLSFSLLLPSFGVLTFSL